MNEKPIIGITPCSRIDDYIESVKRAGGEPLVMSHGDDPASVLDHVDGVLLTGGLDVDPSLYGQKAHSTTEPAPDRDRFEIPLSKGAIDRRVPVLAICRGVQVLNVAAGGTLLQDIPSGLQSDLPHSVDVPKDAIAHQVRVAPGTTLARALGSGSFPETCDVNSRHHQAVDKIAPEFIVSAVSPDGVVEAIEHRGATFCIGVQWHPENFWRTGEFSGLFDSFVEAARTRKQGEGLDMRSVRKEIERS